MMTMRTRQPGLGLALAAVLSLAACGNGQKHVVTPPPRLPRTVADALAQRSDAVAQALDAGDSCLALALARDLQQQSIGAVNSGRVAAALQEPLQGAVNQLAARIQCVAPPSGEGNGNGRHKKKRQHGEGGD
jgi:hypothetical protein